MGVGVPSALGRPPVAGPAPVHGGEHTPTTGVAQGCQGRGEACAAPDTGRAVTEWRMNCVRSLTMPTWAESLVSADVAKINR